MIPINELRHGSWYINSKEEFEHLADFYDGRVNPSVSMEFHHNVGGDTTEEIFAIPIVPEILSLCGFEETPFKGIIGYMREFENRMTVLLLSIPWTDGVSRWSTYVELTEGRGLEILPSPQIEFLHQLQNLCFVLTGEELQIDLV